MPRIGLGAASHRQSLDQQELRRLGALNLSHLRVDLNLAEGDYESDLLRVASEAQAISASLEVAIFLSDTAEDELRRLRALNFGGLPDRLICSHHCPVRSTRSITYWLTPANLQGGEVAPVSSSDPLKVIGLAMQRRGLWRLMLANLSPEIQEVTIEGISRESKVRRLNCSYKHLAPLGL